ncbi:MAG: hypothetical protein CSA66_01075 [Proteobacteria bacterium]|nr:MAG: hypothetical protein CSA66_01075 [Pseudomonadota bacterium]
MPSALAKLLHPTPALVFMDCDGVIYDVNALKCDAFVYALEGAPKDRVDALIDWHKATGGVSRYVKVRRFYSEIYPVDDIEGHIARALERFGAYSDAGYRQLAPRPEALEFARRLGGPECVYVVSGSAESELRAVFDDAGIGDRFAEVCGSPVTKREHVGRILAETGVPPERALFIGDGWGDWDVATYHGVLFLYLAEMSEWADGRRFTRDTAAAATAERWEDVLAALPP